MAIPPSLAKVTTELPYALRVDVEGYVRTVEAAQPEIYEQVEVSVEQVPAETFLFFAGVWRLWTQVEAQRWIVQNSLDLAEGLGASGISAGRFSYTRSSEDTREIRELYRDFMRWLDRREIHFVTNARSVRALLVSLQEQPPSGD